MNRIEEIFNNHTQSQPQPRVSEEKNQPNSGPRDNV